MTPNKNIKPVLGYWPVRGLCAAIRYQLKYCNVDFEMIEHQPGPAPEYSMQPWFDIKYKQGLPIPNLPYLIHGDFKLTESMAIHKYLAQVYDPTLLGKSIVDRANLEMLGGVIQDLNMKTKMAQLMTGSVDEVNAHCDE